MDLAQSNQPESWPHPVEEGPVIEPAFKDADGVQYFMLKDLFNSFAGRALDADEVYTKWQRRCSDEFLRGWVAALEKEVNSPTIKILEIAKLIQALKERLDFALPSSQLIWELAAVAFFDANESPYKYDSAYGREKIARWKRTETLPGFFFRCPLRDLVSLPDMSEEGLATYLKAVEAVNGTHLELLLSKLSSATPKPDFVQALESERNLISTHIG